MTGIATTPKPQTKQRRVGRAERDPDETKYAGRVAARIRHLRKARGWDVKELAQRITDAGFPVSEAALRTWESGIRDASPNSFPALAAVFEMSIRRFLPAE